MNRRLIVGIVVSAGLFSIAIGIQRWFDAHAAESVVHQLMTALDSGNRDAALELLSPKRRNLLEIQQADEMPELLWQRQRGISYRIQGVKISGDVAVANVSVEKDGYVVRPAVYLSRGKTARWKVDRVENLQVDPRYLKRRRAYIRQQGKQLADKLQKALAGRPGVLVERVSGSEIPGSPRR